MLLLECVHDNSCRRGKMGGSRRCDVLRLTTLGELDKRFVRRKTRSERTDDDKRDSRFEVDHTQTPMDEHIPFWPSGRYHHEFEMDWGPLKSLLSSSSSSVDRLSTQRTRQKRRTKGNPVPSIPSLPLGVNRSIDETRTIKASSSRPPRRGLLFGWAPTFASFVSRSETPGTSWRFPRPGRSHDLEMKRAGSVASFAPSLPSPSYLLTGTTSRFSLISS